MVKIEKQFFFLSGLSRSGSTVLASILNQNPKVYVTPTSPLLDQLGVNESVWNQTQAVKAHHVPEQLQNISKRIINAMYKHVPQQIIIDKHRGWPLNLHNAKKVFESDIKTIVTTRDLPSIMASWLELVRKNPDNIIVQKLKEQNITPTETSIMFELWQNYMESSVSSVEKCKLEHPDQLIIVDYDKLLDNPEKMLLDIENFLGIPNHKYDFENIINKTVDDDLLAWGFKDMHKIRTKLQKTSKNPEEILGPQLYQLFAEIESTIKNAKYRFQS